MSLLIVQTLAKYSKCHPIPLVFRTPGEPKLDPYLFRLTSSFHLSVLTALKVIVGVGIAGISGIVLLTWRRGQSKEE